MTDKRLASAYRRLRTAEEPLVLATVTATAGSTYRKAGARMLITRDGRFHGLLGGGCFEGDLLQRAQSVFADGGGCTVLYDMRAADDEIWGLGLGCNGAVNILLQRLDGAAGDQPIAFIADCIERRQRGAVTTMMAACGDAAAGSTYCQREGESINPAPPAAIAEQIRSTLASSLDQQKPRVHALPSGGDTLQLFSAAVLPPRHLLLLGAGPDAVPVERIATEMGWDVTLADHREEYADPERFPTAHRVVRVTAQNLRKDLPAASYDAAVVMSHHIERDAEYLHELSAMPMRYVGMLGPAARRDLLLARLGAAADGLRGRCYGPVGLDLGGDSPESIALSLVAEIHAVLCGRSGESLSRRDQPLHGR